MKRISALMFMLAVTTRSVYAEGRVVLSDVWSRPAADTAVVYATIHNGAQAADKLIGGSSPVATRVELHESSEMKMPTGGSMNGMPMNGSMMTMKSLTSIPISAHGVAMLAPGGYHIMLDLRHDIKAGQRIPLRLHFLHAGWIATVTTVRPMR